MSTPRFLATCAAAWIGASLSAAPANAVKLTRAADRVRVEIGGALFTEYVFLGADRPYSYPVLASDGTALTRDFPMKKGTGDDADHPHHRSLWFAHSDVNGVDFWNEPTGGSNRPKGKIIHEAIDEVTSGSVGVIRDRNRWVAPDGRVFCTDERVQRFSASGDARMIDYEVTIRAPANAPAELRDNKDALLALRLAMWLNLPRPATGAHDGGRGFTGGRGQIVTAEGVRDRAAWGKRAPWCDYHAERNGQVYGVAIFDNPQNLHHPTWWHARDYGLFAANPLGWHDFEPKTTPVGAGSHTIPAGGSITFRYRVLIHLGDEKTARLAERYADYAKR